MESHSEPRDHETAENSSSVASTVILSPWKSSQKAWVLSDRERKVRTDPGLTGLESLLVYGGN